MEGFEQWAQAAAPISAIKLWSNQLTEQEHSSGAIDISEWPPAVRQVSPQQVILAKGGSLHLIWGDGFGHWGIIVESPQGYIPPFTSMYTKRIFPDTIVFHELQ